MSIWVVEWRDDPGHAWERNSHHQDSLKGAVQYVAQQRKVCPTTEFRVVEYVRKDAKE